VSTKNVAAIILAALVVGAVIGSFGIASAGGQVGAPASAASGCSSCAEKATCGEACAAPAAGATKASAYGCETRAGACPRSDP